MCGIVSYFGPHDGVERVLNALELLTYRAPDSSGLAVLTALFGILARDSRLPVRAIASELRYFAFSNWVERLAISTAVSAAS